MARSSYANKNILPELQKFLVERKLAPEKNIPFLETTMIYTHVLRNMANAPQSPLDVLYGAIE